MNTSTETALTIASWLIFPAALLTIGYMLYAEWKARSSPRKRAFKAGRKARKKGLSVVSNPFPIGSVLGEAWRHGWMSIDDEINGEG
jgi:hypothetical protein